MRTITIVLMSVAACCLAAGCVKRNGELTGNADVNRRVYLKMKENYLWADKLPARDESGLEEKTQRYFDDNLRYRDNRSVSYSDDTYGDRFSRIARNDDETDSDSGESASATEKTFDFGFLPLYVFPEGSSVVVFIQVLYVVPGSPADRAGLMRGDVLDKISGMELKSIDNCHTLLGNSTITLEIRNRADKKIVISKGSYYDDPVAYSDVLPLAGDNVGYLLYNHFTDGDTGKYAVADAAYSKKLKDTFREFRNRGVTKLILDLRYNGGGEVLNARLLASLIVKSENLGKLWMYAEGNRFRGDTEYTFMKPGEVGDTKAEIDELFIITSKNTASASELIMHTLKPYYGNKLHIIGATTMGKNVGSREIKIDNTPWVMNPITMRVHDRNGISGYEEGIPPDPGMEMSEFHTGNGSIFYFYLGAIGDYENEWLLNKVASTYFGVAPSTLSDFRGGGARSGQSAGLRAEAGVRQRGLTEAP